MNENENNVIEKEGIASPAAENENAAESETSEAAADDGGAGRPEVAEKEAAEVTAEADDTADEAEAETGADESAGLTDEDRLSAVTDPMFPTFAKGKHQKLDELISDFIKMTSLGAAAPKVSPMALQTPRGSFASADYALSERQRKIAESAGMSYREYYNFLKSMK